MRPWIRPLLPHPSDSPSWSAHRNSQPIVCAQTRHVTANVDCALHYTGRKTVGRAHDQHRRYTQRRATDRRPQQLSHAAHQCGGGLPSTPTLSIIPQLQRRIVDNDHRRRGAHARR